MSIASLTDAELSAIVATVYKLMTDSTRGSAAAKRALDCMAALYPGALSVGVNLHGIQEAASERFEPTEPSGVYNDIRAAVEGLGFTLEAVDDITLSQATDGPIRAAVTATKTTDEGKTRATWGIDWWPASVRVHRLTGEAVTFGSGDYQRIA